MIKVLSKNISEGDNSSGSYKLLALSSPEPDYRLAWLLNNALSINLQRDLSISLTKESPSFAVFMDNENESGTKYTLLSNKNREEGSVFFSEFHAVDFFLKISDTSDRATFDDLHIKIKSIAEISACIPLVLKKKSTRYFFDNL